MTFTKAIRCCALSSIFLLSCCVTPRLYGGMMLDLRFLDGTTTKDIGPGDVNTNIPIQVWARIDTVGGTNGGGDEFGLQFVYYSVLSTRINGGINGGLQTPLNIVPFDNALGGPLLKGKIQELNGDGINDLGSLASSSNDDFARPRSRFATFNTSATGQTQHVFTSGSVVTGVEFLVETVDFHVNSFVAGQSTRFDVAIPSWILGLSPPGAIWWQNHAGPNINGANNGAYFAGTNVTFNAVPEPSTMILAILGAASALAFTHRRRAMRAS